MRGAVDNSGRALLTIELRTSHQLSNKSIQVWIDTGFTGDLVIPQSVIDLLRLPQSGSVDALLADGSRTELNTFSCMIEWFGKNRNVEVIANDGEFPLLGVGLLLGLELRVNYRNLTVILDPGPE